MSVVKKATVNLKKKATLPVERSGDGAHLPQETRRPGHSPVARPVLVPARPSPGSDAFVSDGSSERIAAGLCADGSR